MRYFKFCCLILAAAVAASGAWGDDSYSSPTSEVGNDISSRMNDLKIQKASYDRIQADMALEKKALADARQKDPFSAQAEVINSRIEQDRSGAEGCVSKMLGDIQFLEINWDQVATGDRDFVSSVEKVIN